MGPPKPKHFSEWFTRAVYLFQSQKFVEQSTNHLRYGKMLFIMCHFFVKPIVFFELVSISFSIHLTFRISAMRYFYWWTLFLTTLNNIGTLLTDVPTDLSAHNFVRARTSFHAHHCAHNFLGPGRWWALPNQNIFLNDLHEQFTCFNLKNLLSKARTICVMERCYLLCAIFL